MKIFFLSLAAVVFIFIVILLFSKMTLSFNAEKEKGKKIKTYFEIRWFGNFLKLRKSVKRSKDGKKPSKHVFRKKSDVKDDESFFQKVKNAYNTFCAFKKAYKSNSGKIRKAIFAKKINLHINFGTGDAMTTGIITGTLWSGVYNVLSFVSKLITIAEPNIDVIPNYNEEGYSIKCECIITSRLVNLIFAAAGIGISYLKFKRSKKMKNNKI